jgi:hypothetical protein
VFIGGATDDDGSYSVPNVAVGANPYDEGAAAAAAAERNCGAAMKPDADG